MNDIRVYYIIAIGTETGSFSANPYNTTAAGVFLTPCILYTIDD